MVLKTKPEQEENHDLRTLLVEDCRIWTVQGLRRGAILVESGKITKIAVRIRAVTDERVKAHGLLALPGLVDAHAHLRDMGLAYKEDFLTGTSAAAAGGFTTVLDMPNTKPSTDSPRRLYEKMRRAERRLLVNVGFHTAAVTDDDSIDKMAKAGAFSLKLYLPRPISPLDAEDDTVVRGLMTRAALNRIPITVHAEDQRVIAEAKGHLDRSFQELARTHPPEAETVSVSRILRLQKLAKCAVHFCHLTLPSSLKRVHGSHAPELTTEVTPHHILLSDKALVNKEWKAWMVPPLRRESLRRSLLAATINGEVTLIGTDHAPHSIREKNTTPARSPPGVPGLETTLPLLLTLVNNRRITLSKIVSLLSANPARVFGLKRKGVLKKQADGDIVLVDMRRKSKINPEKFLSKAKFTPFEGKQTQGAVHTTIVCGKVVYQEGQIISKPGVGRVLGRT